jgi:hypothetical protein
LFAIEKKLQTTFLITNDSFELQKLVANKNFSSTKITHQFNELMSIFLFSFKKNSLMFFLKLKISMFEYKTIF